MWTRVPEGKDDWHSRADTQCQAHHEFPHNVILLHVTSFSNIKTGKSGPRTRITDVTEFENFMQNASTMNSYLFFNALLKRVCWRVHWLSERQQDTQMPCACTLFRSLRRAKHSRAASELVHDVKAEGNTQVPATQHPDSTRRNNSNATEHATSERKAVDKAHSLKGHEQLILQLLQVRNREFQFSF